MNELSLDIDNVHFQVGSVRFDDYEVMLDEVERLRYMMEKSEVTEDTVKANKKLLTEVRKKRQQLETARKEIHAKLEEPYERFNKQVKDIVKVIDEADSFVDRQVKSLEEQERLHKKDEIKELFDLRIEMYENFPLTFEQFLIENSKVLNKSESMTKIEKSLADWFESKQNDLTAISNLPNADDVMTEYISHPDSLSRVMSIVNTREEQKKQAQKVVQKNNPDKKEYSFKVFTELDAQNIEKYMNLKNIKYTAY